MRCTPQPTVAMVVVEGMVVGWDTPGLLQYTPHHMVGTRGETDDC